MNRLRFGLRTLALLVAAGSLLTAVVQAVEPNIGQMSPTGVQRGTEVDVTFNGSRLGDAKQLLFYSPGIEVKSLTPDKDNKVVAKLAIAADCRLGIHAVRLASAGGISNMRTFTVGPMPEVAEVEPNNLFTAPQQVAMNVTISGTCANEDLDNYVVELKKGQRLNVECEGLRLGNVQFDPYVAILNEARFELARSDDASLLYQDSLCSIVAPEEGKYVIQVRESSFGGGGAAYRLHVGSFPRPTAVYPAGGRPGEQIQAKWIGDAAGEFTTSMTIPSTNDGQPGVYAQDDQGISPSPNPVRVIDLANALEVEPNNTFEQASPGGPAPLALNGIIEQPGDIDFHKFTAKKGQQFDVRVYARKPLRSPLDSVLVIHNAKGANITNNDDSGGPDSYARFNSPADGDYFVSVRDHLNGGGPSYVYRVEITEIKPTVVVGLPEKVQYIPTTLIVHRGNRMALMVNAQRQNFSGDFTLESTTLPPGMTLEALPFTAGKTEVPVLFTAAADANPSGALAYLHPKSADPAITMEGRFDQRTMLIRGENNNDVWGHNADRMAVALAADSPFKIDLVQPKVPLVRNGSMSLKVVATRAMGYTAPIAVKLLYNPNGVGSSVSAVIPENQNETVIPMTANANAALGVSKIVALGTGPHEGGKVEVATQFIDLTIAEQYFKFTFDKGVCEQGQATEFVAKVEKLMDFPGEATCELVGLPNGATSTPVKFTKDTTEIVFPVTVIKDARPGKYTTLMTISKFQQDGEEVAHTLGPGELRIDAPLPPKVDAPKPATTPTPMPMPTTEKPPEKKRLSRLEQLRLEKEQAEKK
ncbi:putative subtilase-type serine protease precursor [Anatilimnocola aggregata]|uniref:Putative subtilase-type serine protease n=1 Tax=Anatilimnocola aggregata TaxID=2528021 RepID=A0A517Y724_9BACT|nr:PPC domain-containing protein [Anatilimnocola aggregata]QDU26034.1 putative subtilase-type serine protease precursor [Anatilimnocola aggregata]